MGMDQITRDSSRMKMFLLARRYVVAIHCCVHEVMNERMTYKPGQVGLKPSQSFKVDS